MFQRAAAIVFSMSLFTPTLLADELPLGCYTNSYDKKHMSKHKGQTVTAFRILLTDARKLENSGATMHAEFDVTLRGKGKGKWGDLGICNGTAGKWKCDIECDGGGFEFAEDASGLTVFNTRGFRVTADGGCGEINDAVHEKPGNRMFRLSKTKLSNCK